MTDKSYAIRTITAKLKIGALVGFIALGVLGCPCALALDPSLDITQYALTAWTVRDGFSLGNIITFPSLATAIHLAKALTLIVFTKTRRVISWSVAVAAVFRNLRERVRQLNGTFECDSEPGRGTTVKAEVPFRPAS